MLYYVAQPYYGFYSTLSETKSKEKLSHRLLLLLSHLLLLY